MEEIMETNLLNLDDTCKMLNLAKSTVYTKVSKNQIPCIKLGGKLLFSETDLIAWIETMKQPVVKLDKQ
jgi:excisionase family DNA binding protein